MLAQRDIEESDSGSDTEEVSSPESKEITVCDVVGSGLIMSAFTALILTLGAPTPYSECQFLNKIGRNGTGFPLMAKHPDLEIQSNITPVSNCTGLSDTMTHDSAMMIVGVRSGIMAIAVLAAIIVCIASKVSKYKESLKPTESLDPVAGSAVVPAGLKPFLDAYKSSSESTRTVNYGTLQQQ